jgi:hypothetical protein
MRADLDALRASLGTVSNVSNASLQMCLDAAISYARNLPIYESDWESDDVQFGLILHSSRLYKRRNSPEGVAGWNDLGMVRILGSDPDIVRLYERHIDTRHAGVA